MGSLFAVTHCGLVMPYGDIDYTNIGSDNLLVA